MPKNTPNMEEDFWRNTIKSETCWFWIGAKDKDGYGRMSWKGKTTRTHVISWLIHFEYVPKGLFVCHGCDNPSCVNPKHLWLGTLQDNNKDRDVKKRHAGHKQTHCCRNHLYTQENTRLDKYGKRHCRQCEHIRNTRSTSTET